MDRRPLVELCGGSAALSLAVEGVKPPIYYRGGKRRFAQEILRNLPPVTPHLVNDPGPWSEFWEVVKSDGEAICGALIGMAEIHPRELFLRLSHDEIPTDRRERVARWTALQHYAYASRPVYRCSTGPWWKTPGFCGASADRAAQRERALTAGNPDAHRWAIRSRTLLDVAQDVRALSGKIRFVVTDVDLSVQGPEWLQIPQNAVVYLDPPYLCHSSGYSHELNRGRVLDIASGLAESGRMVVVSEAEPLQLAGARHVQLSGPRGGGATSSRVRSEWLTIVGG